MPGLWAPATLTILIGQTQSEELVLSTYTGMGRLAVNVLILAPVSLPETVILHVSIDGTAFAVLQSGATDITIPQGKGTQVINVTAQKLKLVAGSAVGADRIFTLAIGVF
jgi:hypothetical protein